MAIDLNQLNAEADQMLASAIKVLNTPVSTPGYRGTNLKPAEKEVARASATREETNKTADESRILAADANRRKHSGEDAKAAAIGDKAYADQQQAQLVADQYRLFSEMFGISTDDASFIAQGAKKINELQPAAEAKLRKVQEMQKVGLLDDPLEYLYTAFQLPAAVADYNREADVVNSTQAAINARLATSKAAGELGAKGVPTIIVSQAKASADLALADATIAKANADDALARVNMDFASKKLAADLSIASATLDTTRLQMQENQNKFQAQIAAIQAADTRANRLITAGNLLHKIADNKGLDEMLKRYDAIIGKPPGSTSRQIFKSLGDEQQRNIAAIATGSGGANTFDAFRNIVRVVPGDDMSPETKATMSWIQSKLSAVDKTIDATAPKETRDARLAEGLKIALAQERAQAHKPGTLFHEVEPAKLIAIGLVGKDSILGKILEPLTQTNEPMKPDIIAKTIAEKLTNPVEAGQAIAQYYNANLTFMNTAANFKLLKIDPIKEYKVPGPNSLFGFQFGDNLPWYDLTKPEEATKYVLILKAKDRAQKVSDAVRDLRLKNE